MNVPIVDLAAPDGVVPESMPAVSAICGNGFLSLATPVLRVGKRHAWRVMILVPHEMRMHFARDLKENKRNDLDERAPLCRTGAAPSGWGAVAVGVRGQAVPWYNAESLWCDARWLVEIGELLTSTCHGTSMLVACAREAIQLVGTAEGGRDLTR